jgi:hypothetical protein
MRVVVDPVPHDVCRSLVTYNEVDDRKMAYPRVTCYCTEASYNFTDQPAVELLCYLVVSHSVNLSRFKYGNPWHEGHMSFVPPIP